MFTYAVLDKHGREQIIGTLTECDKYMMGVYRTEGRDAHYQLSLVFVK